MPNTPEELKAAQEEIMKNAKEGMVVIDGTKYKIEDIKTGVQALNAEKKSLQEKISALEQGSQARADQAIPPTGGEAGTGDVDLETMDRKQFLDFMMKTFKKSMIDPINQDIQLSKREQIGWNVRKDLVEVEKRIPDFWEFRTEMEGLQKEHPSMGPEDLYLLARGKYPDKAKDVDTKKAETDAAKAKESGDKDVFVGLLPTSSLVEGNTKMNEKDAMEAAWNEHMGPIESLLTN